MKIYTSHASLFPRGVYAVSDVSAVEEFDAPRREDGSKPQARDKDTGSLLWVIDAMNADPAAPTSERNFRVKLVGDHKPVPPAEVMPGIRPVEFDGLSVTPWIKEGKRAQQAYSYRATSMQAPAAGGRGKTQDGS